MPDERARFGVQQREQRFTRSKEDSGLSPHARELLTDELREATGRPDAEVSADAARRIDEHRQRSSVVANIMANRHLFIVTLLAAIVVGGIISIATGWYVAVLLAVGLHALATLIVAAGAIQLTTEVEHVAPETAAQLEEEGVADPDRVLTELVEDVADADQAGGVPEVISSGNNERTVSAREDPARSTVQQRSAMTPQAVPGPAAGEGSAVEALPWWVVIGVMVVSVVAVPFFAQGWVVPLIVIPIGLGWVALQRFMAHDERSRSERAPGDSATARRRLAPIAIFVVAGVVWFMLALQLVTGYA
jgi:acyl-CoA synthetase (AMP-forming)/AMP-acid ligase II